MWRKEIKIELEERTDFKKVVKPVRASKENKYK